MSDISDNLYTCPVCGWQGLEENPVFPYSTFEICACCGTEFGLDVVKFEDIKSERDKWLNEGAPWFDDSDETYPSKPEYWDLDKAKKQIENNLKK